MLLFDYRSSFLGGGGIDTFENEYRIKIQHFSIDTFLSFDTFDNPRYF